jgi:hypothetical protein
MVLQKKKKNIAEEKLFPLNGDEGLKSNTN